MTKARPNEEDPLVDREPILVVSFSKCLTNGNLKLPDEIAANVG